MLMPRKKARRLPPKHRARETYRAIKTKRMLRRESMRAVASGTAVGCGFLLVIYSMTAFMKGIPSFYFPKLAVWCVCGLAMLFSAASTLRKSGLAAPGLIVASSLIALATGMPIALISTIGGLLELLVSWSEMRKGRSASVKKTSHQHGRGRR